MKRSNTGDELQWIIIIIIYYYYNYVFYSCQVYRLWRMVFCKFMKTRYVGDNNTVSHLTQQFLSRNTINCVQTVQHFVTTQNIGPKHKTQHTERRKRNRFLPVQLSHSVPLAASVGEWHSLVFSRYAVPTGAGPPGHITTCRIWKWYWISYFTCQRNDWYATVCSGWQKLTQGLEAALIDLHMNKKCFKLVEFRIVMEASVNTTVFCWRGP
jgi:hypothetical protein